jgi:D-alanyl-D-alanine carboxypeptidase/D-alanyl-D-alanine-endopeptidase (penicillin-binding protein 4)
LAQVVQHVLEVSDNEGAETLLRQAAIGADKPASFKGGVKVVKNRLEALGVSRKRLTVYDGSGLARDDEVPVQTLVDVLQVAADPQHPTLRPVVSTLPVAGFTGSLAYRFVTDAPAGLGVVRAKTGTLTAAGVHGLAGIVVTKEGTPLLFAAVADQVQLRKTLAARAQLDVIAAQLATCAC